MEKRVYKEYLESDKYKVVQLEEIKVYMNNFI